MVCTLIWGAFQGFPFIDEDESLLHIEVCGSGIFGGDVQIHALMTLVSLTGFHRVHQLCGHAAAPCVGGHPHADPLSIILAA
ncbi:hypothetical protein BK640_00845 [Pseudomonas protegens]|nr:hypothetical protein BK639_17175 [Pseudomonas protegens]ROM03510.1 hypothetical protein BK641_15370 [Pseudomonas protegens]ROM06306.1 hypothetical protein BK642_17705 [Pseudomonas protegens]ROM14702.1 hypothetical protein BK640_00845 [Pseudomonas protegens]